MIAANKSEYSGEIFDLWDTYHKVVVEDFMSDRAIGEDVEHITTSDQPDPLSVLDSRASAAGLKRLPGDAKHRWHRLMRFERA